MSRHAPIRPGRPTRPELLFRTMSENLLNSSPRQLGPNGPAVGPLALGTWRLTSDDTHRNTTLIETALDAGMNLIDTADVYGLDHGGTAFGECETNLGTVLKTNPALRDRMILATKGGIQPPLPYDSSPAYLQQAVDASLIRLGVECIDLWQVHRPDLFTHPAELADVLDSLQRAGKIARVGVSNFTVNQHDALAAHLQQPLVTTQPEFSVGHLQPMRDGTLDRAMRDGIVPLAWSPLLGGRLHSGKGVRQELLGVLDRVAARENTHRSSIAIAFLLAHPSRPVVLLGTQTPPRLKAALSALSVHLDRTDVYAIIAASEGQPLP
jgi:predicted oxidoreductase